MSEVILRVETTDKWKILYANNVLVDRTSPVIKDETLIQCYIKRESKSNPTTTFKFQSMKDFLSKVRWHDIAIIAVCLIIGFIIGTCTSCTRNTTPVVEETIDVNYTPKGDTTVLSWDDVILECSYIKDSAQYVFIYMGAAWFVNESDAINYINKEGTPVFVTDYEDSVMYMTTIL
jgi:hypothetical protein